MAQKITLTGTPVSQLRLMKSLMGKEAKAMKVYAFDMKESGSPASPKGLPKSSNILFTVFINDKQINKAGLSNMNIRGNKLLIQGEIVIGMDKDNCPGAIGVVAMQLSVLPAKPVEVVENKPQPEPQPKPIEAPIKPEPEPQPKPVQVKEFVNELKQQPKCDEIIPIDKIIIPIEFQKSVVNPKKLEQTRKFVEYSGYLDAAIEVDKASMKLTDGYRRYVVAKEFNIVEVPVKYAK